MGHVVQYPPVKELTSGFKAVTAISNGNKPGRFRGYVRWTPVFARMHTPVVTCEPVLCLALAVTGGFLNHFFFSQPNLNK